MEVRCYEKRGVVVIQMRGNLTHANIDQFKWAMKEALRSGRRNVVTDLQGVTCFDALWLGVLAKSYLSVRGAGGDLKLACASAELNRAIRQAGLAATFPGLQSVDDALLEFSSNTQEAKI